MKRPPGMPDMADALAGLTSDVQMAVIKKTIVDHEVEESKATIRYFGISLQAADARELRILPEGQRNWKLYRGYTTERLENDWVLRDEEGLLYRVMRTNDWSAAGYTECYLVQEPKP